MTINKSESIKEEKKVDSLNVIDLFCGCGGMSKGLTDAGLNIIAGIDIWDKAVESYNKNFDHKAYCEDLTQLPPEKFNDLYNPKNKNIDVLVGGPPCFISGTKVLTNSNYKNIEDVSIKERVMTHTGKFQRIINLQRKIYTGDIYELDIKYHDKVIQCTEEHPFYIREKKMDSHLFDKPIWRRAKDLTENDYFGMVINKSSIIPEFIIGEHKVILDRPDYWHLIGYFVGSRSISQVLKKRGNHFGYSNIIWSEIFKKLEGSEERIIPEWIQDAPISFIREFVNGYLRSDSTLELIRGSPNLAFGMQRLYFKLGIVLDINKNGDPKEDESIPYFIENDYIWIKSLKITKREKNNIPVYNFEVENDNSYIVENTIVHNCQGMSISGKRDKNDPRNSLFVEYVKYLNYFRPKMFMMENVIGMLSMKTATSEKVIDIIMDHLNKDYNCNINKLYASDFEVPQNRRRVIIIGIRKDLNIILKEPEPIIKSIKDRIPVKTILLPKDNIESSSFLSEKAINGIINKKIRSKERGAGFGAQFLDLDKPSYTIPARYWKDGYDALVKYSETEIRRLTILELKRIQSFPDDYIIEGSKKDIIMQIGNAVACRFAYHLGKYVINTLQ
jgi:DNA (cytosine-5)-methyltransferase 1